MTARTLSAGLADTTRTVDAVAETYARATERLASPLARITEGCVEVGAMDGWTVVVRDGRGADDRSDP